jgi:predicted MFS family arabinose efflux permease
MQGVWASPQLRRIITAYGVNRLGTWFGTIAIALAVFDHTQNALAVAAVLVAAQVIPAIAVTPVVARVEASERRRELSALYYFEAAATVAIIVFLSNFSLPALLLFAALDGTAALAANALLRTELAAVGKSELGGEDGEQDANAALNIVFSLAFVLGPVLAGVVIASAGASTALLLDVGSFVICGTLLLDRHPHVEEAAGSSVTMRLRAAWEHVKGVPALKTLLIAQGIGLVFFESAVPIEVAYAKDTLLAGDRGYGVLVSCWGAGVVAGSIIFARAGKGRLVVMMSGGTLAIGAAYLGFAVAPTLLVASLASVVGGVGNGVQYAPVISSLQRLTPAHLQGRVMGLLESISAVSPALGLTLGGVLVAAGSPRFALIVVGIGACLTAIIFARIRLGAPTTLLSGTDLEIPAPGP